MGCRAVLSKRNLIRIVRTTDGVQIDPTGKLSGRGAYLHDIKSCWDKGLKGTLANALRTTISEQDMEALKCFAATLKDVSDTTVNTTLENKPDKEAKMG